MQALARLLPAILIFLPLTALAAPGWIGDTIYVPMRSGPGSGYRIIDKGLKTGTRIEVLDWNSGEDWVEIRYEGKEGYVGAQYVSRTPTASIQLEQRKEAFDQADEKVKTMQAQVSDITEKRDALAAEKTKLEAQLQRSQQELQRLQKAAAEPLKLQRQNQALIDEVKSQRAELAAIKDENAGLRGDRLYRGWRYALATVFGGMFLGWLITTQMGRKRSEWS